MTTRARKKSIRVDVDWENILNKPENLGEAAVTFEALDANGDVGEGATQVAAGDHDHEIGDVSLVFENALV